MQPKRVSVKAILNMLPVAVFCASFWFFCAYAFFVWFDLLQILSKTLVIAFWLLIASGTIFILSIPYFYWRCYWYAVSEETIMLQKGIFWKITETVPVSKVYEFLVVRGPIDRITGLRKVRVVTAGGNMTICFLSRQQVQDFKDIF